MRSSKAPSEVLEMERLAETLQTILEDAQAEQAENGQEKNKAMATEQTLTVDVGDGLDNCDADEPIQKLEPSQAALLGLEVIKICQ